MTDKAISPLRRRLIEDMTIRRRKFAPADAPTRATNEAVQIGRSGAALPLSPRPDQ